MIKNLFKNLFGKKSTDVKSGKESTEPWVNVARTTFDENDPRQGYMELEWNTAFINFLRENGYTGKTDEDLVDKWFTDLCKNIGAQMDEETKFVANADVLPKRRRRVDK